MYNPQKLEFVIESDSLPEEYCKEVIKLAAEAMKLTNWSFEMQKSFVHGQNYFGVLLSAVIKGKLSDDSEKEYPVVIKLAPIEEACRVSGAVTKMYTVELYAYSTLLKKYKELQETCSIPLPHRLVVPEYYYGREELNREALVLKNMTVEGYKPHYGCYVFLDHKHVIASLNALASFHALSFILQEKDRALFDEAAKVFLPLCREVNTRFITVLENRLLKARVALYDTVYNTLIEKLEKNCAQEVEAVFKDAQELVFCHGDMWKENLLFSYEGEERVPSSVCIVDFQNVRTGTPAFDVLYLIASSTTSELRKESFDTFLQAYYERFENILKEAGLEAKSVYSKDSFMKDLKTVGPASFIIANTALWLSCGLQQEGNVRSRIVLKSREEKEKAMDSYVSIIKGILDDFIKYGYLELCDCASNFQNPLL